MRRLAFVIVVLGAGCEEGGGSPPPDAGSPDGDEDGGGDELDGGPAGEDGGQDGAPDAGEDAGGEQEVASATIGVEGGAVELADGARVDVPAGALDEDVEITIRRLADGEIEMPDLWEAATMVYEMLPSGIEFLEPVTVTLPLTVGAIPEGAGIYLAYRRDGDGAWRVLSPEDDEEHEDGGFDLGAGLVWGMTRHFTPIGGGVERIGNAHTLVADDGHAVEVQNTTNCSTIARAARVEAVEGIVVHSTGGGTNLARMACYLADRGSYENDNSTVGAHYVIGREGTIVEVFDPDVVVPHVAGSEGCNGAGRAVNSFLVGIELLSRTGGGGQNAQPYSGAQMAALVRLVEYLLDLYDLDPPSLPRQINTVQGETADTWNAHGDVSVVFHRELEGCRAANARHVDPAGDFRTDSFFVALSATPPGGQIHVSGGDAWGHEEPGAAGTVAIVEDRAAAAVAEDGDDLVVAANQEQEIAGDVSYDDVIVEGTVVLTGDTTLSVYGTFFVSETGRIQHLPGVDAPSLTIHAGGLALVTGRIDLGGLHGYEPLDPDRFGSSTDECWYDVDPNVIRAGGDGGSFELRTRGGPLYVPTLVALGGDGDFWDPETETIQGGAGGSVTITAGGSDVRLHGSPPDVLAFVEGAKLGGYHPIGCSMTGHLDSAIQLDGGDFRRGALTSGGSGPRSDRGGFDADPWGTGGDGGAGGDVTLTATGDGRLIFGQWDVLTGGGHSIVEQNPFVQEYQATFQIWVGCRGGMGMSGFGAGGGDGGLGGPAGDVTLEGTHVLLLSDQVAWYGWSGDNPNFVADGLPTGNVVGTRHDYVDDTGATALRILAAGGSGGGPGGGASGFPGWFGTAGGEGTITVP